MTSRLTGYVGLVMHVARELPLRPAVPWRVEALTEIEKTRVHVAATWRFLDDMRLRMGSMERQRARTAHPIA